jgi:hypothetical protein
LFFKNPERKHIGAGELGAGGPLGLPSGPRTGPMAAALAPDFFLFSSNTAGAIHQMLLGAVGQCRGSGSIIEKEPAKNMNLILEHKSQPKLNGTPLLKKSLPKHEFNFRKQKSAQN